MDKIRPRKNQFAWLLVIWLSITVFCYLAEIPWGIWQLLIISYGIGQLAGSVIKEDWEKKKD